jgi:hypothetical protein
MLNASFLGGEVVLNFDDPEEFTDFEYAQTRRTITTDFFSKNVMSRLDRALEKVLSEGVVLTLEFQDIDLAGGFEPWQPIGLDDVRMFKSRYPPGAEFSYRLVSGDGEVLAEGVKKLRDLGYEDRYSRRKGATDPFYYEWRMLERWIKTELVKQSQKS